MRPQTMSIPNFMQQGWAQESFIDSLKAHLDRNKVAYRIIGTTIIIFLTAVTIGHAADGSIDGPARKLYDKLISVGKWVIIFKGGLDTIKHMTDGDFDSAKKKVLQYVLIFCMLIFLPWAIDQAEGLLKSISVSGN